MEEGEIEEVLGKLESEFSRGNYEAAKILGFWKTVNAAKKNPKLAAAFGERIGRIDKLLFESKAWVKLGYRTGTVIELTGAVLGFIFLYLGTRSTGTESTLFYTASSLILTTALHPISHVVAAWLTGIKFHFYFLNGPLLFEPTLKVDYATYVKTPARMRVLFHLAGAINSVLMTFFVLIVALLDSNASGTTKTVLAIIWLFTTASEAFPLIFTRLGMPKILFADFRKSDSYRALREWRIWKNRIRSEGL